MVNDSPSHKDTDTEAHTHIHSRSWAPGVSILTPFIHHAGIALMTNTRTVKKQTCVHTSWVFAWDRELFYIYIYIYIYIKAKYTEINIYINEYCNTLSENVFLLKWRCESAIPAYLQIQSEVLGREHWWIRTHFLCKCLRHHAFRAAEESGRIPSPVCLSLGFCNCEHLLDLTLHRALCVQHHKQMCCLYRLLGLCTEMNSTVHWADFQHSNQPK